MNGFDIRGLKELEAAINQAYSGPKAKKLRKDALNAGGELVVKKLKDNFEKFKNTGYSREEIVKTNPKSKNDVEQVQIGWNGPHERWRLVHLNEFGYTKLGKQYTPKGFGTIDKTVKETQNDYFNTIVDEMRKRL